MAITDGLVVALLAAGGSTRFGPEDKLAATLGGRPLIRWAAEAALGVEAARHIAVTNGSAVADLPEGLALVRNDEAGRGLSTSLRLAALAAQEAGAEALLILLADMPFVGADHLRAMIGRFDAGRPLFSRVPGGSPQPPALFPTRLFPALLEATGDQGARRFAEGADFIEANADQLLDIDTPADLEWARGLIP